MVGEVGFNIGLVVGLSGLPGPPEITVGAIVGIPGPGVGSGVGSGVVGASVGANVGIPGPGVGSGVGLSVGLSVG